MPKTIRFSFSTPPIQIQSLDDPEEWATVTQFERSGITGRATISFDKDSIDWELYEDTDPETGETINAELVPKTCSGLIVVVEAQAPEGTKAGLFLGTVHSVVVDTLALFLAYVRLELGQFWVELGPIRDWGLFDLIRHGHAVEVKDGSEQDVGFPLGGFPPGLKASAPQAKYPHSSRSLTVEDAISLASWVPPESSRLLPLSLLSDARKHLSLGDRRAASIEAITALESVLEPFIKARCRARGITAAALDNYDKSHFIADYLKLLLPLVIEEGQLQLFVDETLTAQFQLPLSFAEGDILQWAIDLNKARNDAVHKGVNPPFEVLDRGIFAAGILVAYALAELAPTPPTTEPT